MESVKRTIASPVSAGICRSVPRTLAATLLLITSTSPGWAQEPAAEGGGKDLRAAAQNPISSLISLPFKLTFDNGADNGDANILNINPVVPVNVGNWNLVNRALIPIIDAPGGVSGLPSIPNPTAGERETGLGDINYSVFVSPVKYDKVIWGLGPSITLPTATEDQLGSGKWSLGPTFVALAQPKWGSAGILLRQLWSFAGESDRSSVSQALIEPFVNYNLEHGWYLLSDSVLTANWNASAANTWTVPIGGGGGRLFKLGNQPINAKLEAYYNVVRPDGAPEWTLSFQWAFLFPK
jgi:hypothetical protein